MDAKKRTDNPAMDEISELGTTQAGNVNLHKTRDSKQTVEEPFSGPGITDPRTSD
ncbi:hypothetical protein ACFFK0_09225 [Paenibacillus chartarius]|uniref:Uncharacterized protein n=1 Tax=Paenibacillus chartarius TaxID=747481 RepID=A0ABV6DJ36_9BACL